MYIYILKTCIYISMYVNLDFRNNNNFCYYCHSQFLYSKLKFATSRKIYSCLLHLIFQMTFVNVTYWKVQYLKTQILQSMVVLGTHNLFDLNELPFITKRSLVVASAIRGKEILVEVVIVFHTIPR